MDMNKVDKKLRAEAVTLAKVYGIDERAALVIILTGATIVMQANVDERINQLVPDYLWKEYSNGL